MKVIEMQQRKKDMFSGEQDLEPLYTFKNFPIYCGVTEEKSETDIYADMRWMISQGSGMIQLGELVPGELLYSKSHNASIGGIWQRHHRDFADFLHEYINKGDGVVEIGGGNGILNVIYNQKYTAHNWVIVDPTSVEIAAECNARYIKAMWEDSFDLEAEKIECDILVHSHLMEHQYDLRSFMSLNAKKMKSGQRMVFTVPNLKEWVRRKYSNALFFEHTYLITEDYIDIILKKYGYKILKKQYFGDGHSIFYATEKIDNIFQETETDYRRLYNLNRKEFTDFVNHNKAIVQKANEFIETSCGNVWLFGAHIFAQYLINSGLKTERINGILDNDRLKQGKRLYGTELNVFSPKILSEEQEPRLILNAGAYTQEIKEDILKNINNNTIILE